MSFSSDVKEELSLQETKARHCMIAELAAIITMCGHISIDSRGGFHLKIRSENLAVARKCFTLLSKAFNIRIDTSVRLNKLKDSRTYYVIVNQPGEAMQVLQAVKLVDSYGEIAEVLSLKQNVVIQATCCKRAFIRGAFLAAGSISDPQKQYHFEISCATEEKAMQMKDIMQCFDLDAKVVPRKKVFVVYLKEGAQIVDVLNVMEAHISLMNLENLRIVKEVRNSVNRQVNCETANLNKTVSAAVKQIEDIQLISRTIGLDNVPDNLREVALIRLEFPEASLKELGKLLSTPVGKSGVNHRLKKLGEIADNCR